MNDLAYNTSGFFTIKKVLLYRQERIPSLKEKPFTLKGGPLVGLKKKGLMTGKE
jgi:hypothetical protein